LETGVAHSAAQKTLTFFKSSYSAANCSCVEVAHDDRVIRVRDSKLDPSPQLSFARESWTAFIEDVRAGRVR
jgi:hypothetical protein